LGWVPEIKTTRRRLRTLSQGERGRMAKKKKKIGRLGGKGNDRWGEQKEGFQGNLS